MCYCKWCEAVLAIVIIVLAWPDLVQWQYSAWTIVIAAALILIHGLGCKKCKDSTSEVKSAQSRRVKRKK